MESQFLRKFSLVRTIILVQYNGPLCKSKVDKVTDQIFADERFRFAKTDITREQVYEFVHEMTKFDPHNQPFTNATVQVNGDKIRYAADGLVCWDFVDNVCHISLV